LPSDSVRRLLRWFDRNARPLPWRRDRDPYRIWVSEVMLQQTTVAAVARRFEQFLKEFPDVRALANSDEQQVLKAWEGLGYYSRARNLHHAARSLVESHGGRLPDDPKVWSDLPGVGRYILGAVLSQAFDRPLPIVEANSRRVLCRLFGQTGDPNSPAVQSWLWQTAQKILPENRVGDFNQAIMELGALVCTAESPACDGCPLRAACRARRDGVQDRIPLRPRRPATVEVREACVVIRRGGNVLLMRRPDVGRWPNMWEFPRTRLEGGESPEDGARRLLVNLGVSPRLDRELSTIRYGVTRFRMTMTCFSANARSRIKLPAYYEESRWVRPDQLHRFPISSPQRRLAAMLQPASQEHG
jgi:A/G-specific adenine glycosylase